MLAKGVLTLFYILQQFVPSYQHVAPPESWQMQQLGEYPSEQMCSEF